MATITLVGILNITPDSFSDGGEFIEPARALAHAAALREAGAGIIDVGADSTRPGSTCTGPAEEWRRLEPVLPALIAAGPVSIDTHHAETAARGVTAGAGWINDISAGADPAMFETAARSGATIIIMYSRCPAPHDFVPSTPTDIVDHISGFFTARLAALAAAGVPRERIILDPGMGGFISEAPHISWELIERFGELTTFGLPLMFASSRKGFLKRDGERSPRDRDALSALTGALVATRLQRTPTNLFIRTHNIALQREFLERMGLLGPG